MRAKKLKRDLMENRIKKAKKDLELISHTFIRRRDSDNPNTIQGNCFDCGKFCVGQQFQAGHWIPDSAGGATLRYHPQNMNGQNGGCNTAWQQEKVKIDYTLKMIEKHGMERVEALRRLKKKVIKANILWYLKMIELYQQGDEKAIVDFLEL